MGNGGDRMSTLDPVAAIVIYRAKTKYTPHDSTLTALVEEYDERGHSPPPLTTSFYWVSPPPLTTSFYRDIFKRAFIYCLFLKKSTVNKVA